MKTDTVRATCSATGAGPIVVAWLARLIHTTRRGDAMGRDISVNDVDGGLRLLMGKVKAMETLLNALVLSHPQPALVRELWVTGMDSLFVQLEEKSPDAAFDRSLLDTVEGITAVVNFAADGK
jgi:hypothetical protein